MTLDEATNYLVLRYSIAGLEAFRFSDVVDAVEFARQSSANRNGSDIMLFRVAAVEFEPGSNRTPADAG